MRKLAPDLTDEMTRRALILERISVLQPVGRRQLAARLNLPEREIRNTAVLLKELGYLELDASGMTLSRKAEEVLDSARDFSKAMNGLTETENRLAELLPVDRVLIAPGDADEDAQVLSDVGRICAVKLRSILQNGNTLAVTGGSTVAAVARSIQSQTPLNVMVVPARGGIGRSVELQANTLAEEIAGRLEMAARGDYCIVLYNPASHKRRDHLQRACDILLRYASPDTVCAAARCIAREGQETRLMTLRELRDYEADMFTTLFVGSSRTKIADGKMVTPRGYERSGR